MLTAYVYHMQKAHDHSVNAVERNVPCMKEFGELLHHCLVVRGIVQGKMPYLMSFL